MGKDAYLRDKLVEEEYNKLPESKLPQDGMEIYEESV